MAITKYADWLNSEDDEIFFWHHVPQVKSKNCAIIIIGPIGPEYMPCHRSIKLLAENAALSGYNCIRYDPIGMGNSSGNLQDSGLWDKWVNTPNQLAQFFHNTLNINDFIFIGLRSGCLVLSEAQKKLAIKNIIFWHPQSRGVTFMRGLQLLDSVLYNNTAGAKTNTLEGGGYPFNEELQIDIKQINLISTDYLHTENALVINNEESSSNSQLTDKLCESGIKTESLYLDGLDNMIKQVTLSKIPHANIDNIINWINNLEIEKTNLSIKTPNVTRCYTEPKFTETIVEVSDTNTIYGILTTPNVNNKNKIVIFTNTGAAHHAGPNRIHVEAARILAEHGISTLRIDLSNLGDSASNYTIDPPEEFPVTAARDINTVISYINNKHDIQNIVLCGISAGAHNAFHAALVSENKNISKLIIINPETFYWQPNKTVFSTENTKTDIDQIYYKKQIYNYKKWLTLITNPEKIYNTSIFLFIFAYKKLKSILIKSLSIFNIKIKSRLENDITQLGNRGISIHLIYSKGDPGHEILMSQASGILKTYSNNNLYSSIQINNADHTFSSMASRQELYMALIKATTDNQ